MPFHYTLILLNLILIVLEFRNKGWLKGVRAFFFFAGTFVVVKGVLFFCYFDDDTAVILTIVFLVSWFMWLGLSAMTALLPSEYRE
jgi:hypothetical protein